MGRKPAMPNDSAKATKSGLPKSTANGRPNSLRCFQSIRP